MSANTELRNKIIQETSRIPWRELQYFFASGKAIYVSSELDLVNVAVEISTDNKAIIERWMTENKIAEVSNAQAKQWVNSDAELWSTVISPWILVQYKPDTTST